MQAQPASYLSGAQAMETFLPLFIAEHVRDLELAQQDAEDKAGADHTGAADWLPNPARAKSFLVLLFSSLTECLRAPGDALDTKRLQPLLISYHLWKNAERPEVWASMQFSQEVDEMAAQVLHLRPGLLAENYECD